MNTINKSRFILTCVLALSSVFKVELSAQVVPFINTNGGRIDWAKKGIVGDHDNLSGYYSVSIIQPNGSGYAELTKGKAGCPQKNNGNPAIDPFGRYVIFEVEKDVKFDSADVHYGPSSLSNPGSGVNCDLWVLDLTDSVFTRLTDLPTKKTLADTTKFTGVLHPQFSHDGKKILWTQCINAAIDGPFGLWELNISDFDTTGGIPKLTNTMHYYAGGILGNFTFIETSGGFTSNDSTVIYCANASGQPESQLSIYTFNFYTNKVTRLTIDTMYNEHSHFDNLGSKVLWMSTRGIAYDTSVTKNQKTDYWLMDNDSAGTNKTRLTFFNDTTSTDYKNFAGGGRVIASDNVWSPFGGDTALCYLQVYDSTGKYTGKDVFLVIPSSIVTGLAPSTNMGTFLLFPNPGNGNFTVQTTFTGTQLLQVFDITGKLMYNQIIYSGKSNVDASNLAQGVYTVSISSDKERSIKKLVIVK